MSSLLAPAPGAHRPAETASPAAAGRRLLARVRREWITAVALRGAVAALAVAVCVLAGLLAIDLLVGLPAPARRILAWAPVAAAALPLGAAALRLARRPGDARVALLAEERLPGLRNVLATATTADPGGRIGRLFEARLATAIEAAIERHGSALVVPPEVGRPARVLLVGAVLLVALSLLAGGPRALAESWRRPAHEAPLAVAPGSPLARAAAGGDADGVRLGALRWTAVPPRYAAASPTGPSGEEPVRALAGSSVSVRLAFAAPRVEWSARLIGGERRSARVAAGGDRVEASFTLLPELRGLELVGRRAGDVVARRVVPLAPVPDAPPEVTMPEPARDEVLARADVVVPVRARARDDHGVAELRLAWIRSRGSGESFAFEEGESAFDSVRREGGGLTGEARLDLAALGLRPGDVLHLRAVARDGNDVTGPGVGVSPTRVLRIAAEGQEHEVTALIGAPPDVDERPVLSQRMIILMTERLLERASGLARAEVAAEARRIALEQGRLRARVGEILFVRSTGGIDAPEELADPFGSGWVPHGHDGHEHVEGDEGWDPTDPDAVLEAASRATGEGTLEEIQHLHDDAPVISVDRDLLAAYNAMWDAERALRQAAADSALPHEHRALELLQRVREGERVFVRGRVAVAPVDVAGARGTGELSDVAVAGRAPASAPGEASAASELEAALALLRLPPARAALALSELSARLLALAAIDAATAALLSRAATAAGEGRAGEAASHLAVARARLEPTAPSTSGRSPGRARDAVAAAYHRLLAGSPDPDRAAPGPEVERPFVFATARYASGDWDSAPLVPANLIHSLAQYTAIPLEPEAVVVDLASEEVFEHPFLFLTGHLPVRFTEAESRNLRAYVERGGFVFVDDHNHDIDGAFHRTATAELARIFGPDALRPLPNDHELYRAFFRFADGPPITTHELNGWGDGLIHEELHAILVDGRIGVLYSNKDYASEWNYHAVNKRFQAIDNTRFGVNVLLYSLTR